jgi:aspartyl/asparaginyl beta-hydroxylase (cupin superfamily)
LRVLDHNYQIIRDELDAVLGEKHRIPRYHELSEKEILISGTVNPEKDWRVFMLATSAGIPTSNQAKCPKTTALLSRIPRLFQAFFSILDPGKPIPPNCGPYLGYLRYHLGLRIPKNNPPTMRVRDKFHTWKEGQSIVFDDSLEHEVYNQSDDIRVVLIALHFANWSLYQIADRYGHEGKGVLERIEKYSSLP